MEKRAVTAVVLGASGRGKLYGDYALEHPEDLKIVGIAELVDLRRTMYGDKYGVPVENRVATWQQMLDRPKFADAVIIATPDHLHYEPCITISCSKSRSRRRLTSAAGWSPMPATKRRSSA